MLTAASEKKTQQNTAGEDFKQFLVDLVTDIVAELVDDEDKVKVRSDTGPQGTFLITIKAHESELGKVIGKRGRTADALRTLVYAMTAKARREKRLRVIIETAKDE